jgi:hypothetical protein
MEKCSYYIFLKWISAIPLKLKKYNLFLKAYMFGPWGLGGPTDRLSVLLSLFYLKTEAESNFRNDLVL